MRRAHLLRWRPRPPRSTYREYASRGGLRAPPRSWTLSRSPSHRSSRFLRQARRICDRLLGGRWAWTCWTWRWSSGARGEAFALATVVRCERPTSAKPGAKALIRGDGAVTGWVGGACAEPVVVREALKALRDGQPRLVALVGEGGAEARRVEGLVPYPMTCHSGGTLEIYVEPFVPKPLLVLVGHGPVLETLAALGRATDFDVMPLAIDAAHEDLAPPVPRSLRLRGGRHARERRRGGPRADSQGWRGACQPDREPQAGGGDHPDAGGAGRGRRSDPTVEALPRGSTSARPRPPRSP